MDLLSVTGTVHALSKLRLHTDATVSSLHHYFICFCNVLRKFESATCSEFQIVETRHEQKKRLSRLANNAAKATTSSRKKAGASVFETRRRVPKPFNLNTSKLHALGDYARTILRFGTTDSYNTAIVCTIIPTQTMN